MLFRKPSALFLLPVLAGLTSPADALVIDTFRDDPGINFFANSISNINAGLETGIGSNPDSTILGGYRDMYVHVNGGDITTELDTSLCSLVYSDSTVCISNTGTDFGPGGHSVITLIWDGGPDGNLPLNPDSVAYNKSPDANVTGLGVADLTQNNSDPLLFDATGFYLKMGGFVTDGIDITMTVWSNSGANKDFLTLTTQGMDSYLFFPFADFNPASGFGAGRDFKQASAVQLVIDGDIPSYQVRLFSLDTRNMVPEPASLALMALGLGGLGWSRRRAS